MGGVISRSEGLNSTFSEHGHIVYQIKWNHECSNMVDFKYFASCLFFSSPESFAQGESLSY